MRRWTIAITILVGCTEAVTADELVIAEPPPPTLSIDALPREPPPDPRARERPAAPEIPAGARIEMRRGACYGSCPIYRVVLTADGTARWYGERFVEVRGEREAAIDPVAFARLWRKLMRHDFSALPQARREEDAMCPEHRTDHPTVTVMVGDGRVNRIAVDDTGCFGYRPLETFRQRERLIDVVAGTKRWVGRCRDGSCTR